MAKRKRRNENWKAAQSDYKFIEDEVRLYQMYKKLLLDAVDNIYYGTPEFDNNGGGKSNLPSRPTENKAIQVHTLLESARIRHLNFYIKCIEEALHELDEEKQQFIARLYWSNKKTSLEGVATEFCVSISTANRWRSAYLLRVAMLTGAKRNVSGE